MINKLHYMLDFETLGLRPNSKVLSMGFCVFSDKDGVFERKLFNFDPNAPDQENRHLDLNTAMWWGGQKVTNPEAWKATFEPTKVHTIKEALEFFVEYTLTRGVHAVWANGIDFDISLLQNLLDQEGLKAPFPYWAKGELRTIKALYPLTEDEKPKRMGVFHTADSDAEYQTKELLTIAEKYDLVLDDINKRG